MATFLFDLDMTLLDSSGLATWRTRQMWHHVRNNLGRVRPFAIGTPMPHEVPARVRQQGHRVAVVTSSPRWYAERLIEQFGIETEALVAYEDTELHKPNPEPILRALEMLDENAEDAYAVGDSPMDAEASYHAGVRSVGAGWGVENFEELSSSAPDVLLLKPGSLLRFGELGRRSYFAEVICEGVEPKAHRGAILPCGESPRRYALGRYFKREDPRCAGSGLAEKILELKNEDGPAPLFGQALAMFVRVLLVDDVLTTGGTMMECARVLTADKASEVRGVAFGRDQEAFVVKECARCGRRMRIRTNSATGENFWGCSGYPDDCRHTDSI